MIMSDNMAYSRSRPAYTLLVGMWQMHIHSLYIDNHYIQQCITEAGETKFKKNHSKTVKLRLAKWNNTMNVQRKITVLYSSKYLECKEQSVCQSSTRTAFSSPLLGWYAGNYWPLPRIWANLFHSQAFTALTPGDRKRISRAEKLKNVAGVDLTGALHQISCHSRIRNGKGKKVKEADL